MKLETNSLKDLIRFPNRTQFPLSKILRYTYIYAYVLAFSDRIGQKPFRYHFLIIFNYQLLMTVNTFFSAFLPQH